MKENTRKNADPTRRNILKAAQHLFCKQGFSGTPMQAIADKAKVNQALLYHHFKNKQTLWRATKIKMVEDATKKLALELPPASAGLAKVIKHIIEQRAKLYHDNPQIARMMLWQKLEPGSEELMGGNSQSPDAWLTTLKELQALGEMRKDLDPKLLISWLACSVSSLTTALPQTYIDMLVKEFVTVLGIK